MPHKPARLNLAPHAPAQSSRLAYPVSPRSPSTPLTAPPRLHLRNVLPSPPISPACAIPAPSFPLPWIWRCHLCHTTYVLSVTRRCLEDGHYFCSIPPTTSSSRKRRKPPRICTSEFDYTGWARYNDWRRQMSILKAERAGREFEYPTAKNCWEDCDFPSECLNEQGRVDRDVGIFEIVEDEGMNHAEEESKSQSEKEGEIWRELVMEEVWDEEDEKEVRRKKSLQKIQQLTGVLLTTDIPLVMPTNSPESPPSSPLKTFSSVDEQDTSGVSIWDIQPQNNGRRGSEDPLDGHLQDLLRTGNLFLERFEEDYQDEFEDVVM